MLLRGRLVRARAQARPWQSAALDAGLGATAAVRPSWPASARSKGTMAKAEAVAAASAATKAAAAELRRAKYSLNVDTLFTVPKEQIFKNLGPDHPLSRQLEPPVKVTRSKLLSKEYARILDESSLVLFVEGSVGRSGVKQQLEDLGFGVIRTKASLIKIALHHLSPEDESSLVYADAMSRGSANLVYFREPLQALQGDRLKALEKVLPLAPPKKDVFAANVFFVAGAFLRDASKRKQNVFLSAAGTVELLANIKKESDKVPNSADFSPEQLFQASFVAALRQQLGAVRAPLQAVAPTVTATLRKGPASAAHVLAQVKELRTQEAEDNAKQ